MAIGSVGNGTSARRILGVILLLAAPAVAFGVWYSARGPLTTLAWFEQHRNPADSAAYASALYHASHARATQANRWHVTGYATLSLVGALAGVGLILSGSYRRTA
jgi:hypothetical protein